MLWIDGVGAWLLFCGNPVVIGGPVQSAEGADLSLMAPISRRHASLLQQDDAWFFQPHQTSSVGGKPVTDKTVLHSGDVIQLGDKVRLKFRIPSVLSASAVLDLESFHQPSQSVSGVLLMVDTILLGPRSDHHVCCPEWPGLIVLFRRAGRVYCRSDNSLKLNDQPLQQNTELSDGAVISAGDFRFRLQRLHSSG
jgi:hypothetical protein